MKSWKVIVFGIIFCIIGWGFINLWNAKKKAAGEAESLRNNLNQVQEENKNLNSELQYFQNPDNLVKELESQTNYKKPGEKVIIIVPGTTSTATSSTSAQ